MSITLYGYKYSVYSWVVRFVLAEKNVACDYIEVNPFDVDMDPNYLELNPWQRVPTLTLSNLVLYETAAICRFVDEQYGGRSLQPSTTLQRARMNQIISIVDHYGYRPMVRQVFSEAVFSGLEGRAGDPAEIATGFEKTEFVLTVLEEIVTSEFARRYLCDDMISLADIYLAPMMDYFVRAPEARSKLEKFPGLSEWWYRISISPNFVATRPCFAP